MLTLDYRPARFADLVGQKSARLTLQCMVQANKVSPAFLFKGPSGSGKTSAARILAAALNCPNVRYGDCCADCDSCRSIRSGQSLALHEIDAASHGGVDDIRQLRYLVGFAADHPWRVVVLDEAHAASRQAFDAMLKMLEEPPARTVFALLTTEADKIPPTVRSRTHPILFGNVGCQPMLDRLTVIRDAEQMPVSDQVLTEIARLSDGGMRGAIVLLDQVSIVGIRTVAQLHLLLGISNAPADVNTRLLAGDLEGAIDHVGSYFRHAANVHDFVWGMFTDLHQRFLCHQIGKVQLLDAAKLLWGARSVGVTASRNSQAQTEALVAVLYTKLAPADQQHADTPGEKDKAM